MTVSAAPGAVHGSRAHRVRVRRPLVAAAIVVGQLGALLLAASPAHAAYARPGSVLPGPEVGLTRSVPGYALADSRVAKIGRAASPAWDTFVRVGTPAGAQALWGDWNGDGAVTPGTFSGGTWTLWSVAVGKAPQPDVTIGGFGAAGDIAVTGDWNGDGRTDLGVFRAGTFFLSTLSGTTLSRTSRIAFGSAGDVPLVGDWDGNGTDDLAVRRGTRFFLRGRPAILQPPLAPVTPAVPAPGGPARPTGAPSPSASPSSSARASLSDSVLRTTPAPSGSPAPGTTPGPSPTPVGPPPPPPLPVGIPAGSTQLQYGGPADEPVAGDWDGDGKDTVGVVRGSAWLLRDDLYPGAATTTVAVTRAAGSVPLPWRAPVGAGTSCPYLASVPVSARHDANAALVVAPHGLRQPTSDEDVEGKARAALGNAERYLVQAGYPSQVVARRPYPDLLGYWGPAQVEYAIRIPAMRAVALSVGLSTQTWDSGVLGVEASAGRSYLDWTIRGVACEHAAFTPGGWGYGWQTAHWAMLTGLGAWLNWGELQPQTQEYAATMVTAEADHLLTLDVPYWRGPGGQELSPGDSKAEENSWNAALLQLAAAMMPQHPRAALWQRKAVDYQLSSFATPGDAASAAPVNGVEARVRLRGSNAEPDGIIVNQGVRNPDYFSTVQQNWWGVAFARLADQQAPESATFQAQRQWNVMTTRVFSRTNPDGTVQTGPVYGQDGSIFFPEGTRWGVVRRAQFASLDAFRLLTTRDPNARYEAETFLSLHLDGQLALQARNPDGRTFQPGEDSYPGREEYAASEVALSWLALYVDAWMPVDTTDRSFEAPLPQMTGLVPAAPGTPLSSPLRTGAVGVIGPVGPVAASERHPSP